MWGSYPMVPWAGRVRRRPVRSEGRGDPPPDQLLQPHAIHGTGFAARWECSTRADGSVEMPSPPTGSSPATARQHFSSTDTSLVCWLRCTPPSDPMPAIAGWHPWFLTPDGRRVRGDVPARRRRHPDRRAGRPAGGPWDDCFVGPDAARAALRRRPACTVRARTATTGWSTTSRSTPSASSPRPARPTRPPRPAARSSSPASCSSGR